MGRARRWARRARHAGVLLRDPRVAWRVARAGEGTRTTARLVARLAAVHPDQAEALARALPGALAVDSDLAAELLGEVISTHPHAAVAVATALPVLLAQHDPAVVRGHLQAALASGDPGAWLRGETASSVQWARAHTLGVGLDEVLPVLRAYARAHAGRPVELVATDGEPWTEGVRLHLPARIQREDGREHLAYRVGAARLAAYLEYGTFDLDLRDVDGPWGPELPDQTDLERLLRSFPAHQLARDVLRILEDRRLETRLRLDYPGLARDLDALAPRGDVSAPEHPATHALLALRRRLWGLALPVPRSPRVDAALDAVLPVVAAATAPSSTVEDVARALPAVYARLEPLGVPASIADPLRPEALTSADRAVEAEARRRSRAGDGARAELRARLRAAPADEPPEDDTPPGQAVATYPEWDADAADYRPGWVSVTEHAAEPVGSAVADEVLARRAALVRQLRRRFEVLRPEPRPQRRLTDGEELDLDAILEDRAERRAGGGTDRLYARRAPLRRSLAVALVLDRSSSTRERTGGTTVLELAREAVLCAGEALDALGDPFAVFAFSGYGRERVVVSVAKDFDDPWDRTARARTGGLAWGQENRDGAVLRHVIARLLRVEAHARVLLLLSDGRPLDCGDPRYRDAYAREDTRRALGEARSRGVRALCLTVDPQGQDYLGAMYGRGAYEVVRHPDELPVRLPRVLERLAR